MKYSRLSAAEVDQALVDLEGWQLGQDGKSISRQFEFSSFSEAFGFMTVSALAAEELDHHPIWTNDYRRVDVRLFTHVTGGLTDRDMALAAAMNKAFGKSGD